MHYLIFQTNDALFLRFMVYGYYLVGLPTSLSAGVVRRSTKYRRLFAPWIIQKVICFRLIQLLTVERAIFNSVAKPAGVTQLLSSSSIFIYSFCRQTPPCFRAGDGKSNHNSLPTVPPMPAPMKVAGWGIAFTINTEVSLR